MFAPDQPLRPAPEGDRAPGAVVSPSGKGPAPRVLLVEDSRSSAALLARRIRQDLSFDVDVAENLAAARALLKENEGYMAGLLDLNLPDAPNGESVDLAIAHKVPAIVFTGELSETLRESFWQKHIVDYVLKDGPGGVDYVLRLLARLEKNPRTKILVVDDSRSYRFGVSLMLSAHRYHVLEAGSGEEALRVLEANPDVRLVTVDYHMPGMDGFALTREIRKRFGKDVLAVVGVSGVGEARLSARFIKSGANDYLNKPFSAEEFYTRITQNLEMLEHIAQIRDMAERDYLTRVYNRRYFFTAGAQLHALFSRRSQPMTVAMLDIDRFKDINDAYGHEVGDAVLRQVAATLSARLRSSDIVARLGGEEFCVLASEVSDELALVLFDELRKHLEAVPLRCGDDVVVPYTVSIGLCSRPGRSLDAMLQEADRMLYRAKSAGRNRVMIASCEA